VGGTPSYQTAKKISFEKMKTAKKKEMLPQRAQTSK